MPELPEVETVRDGLARHVLGARVTGVTVLRESAVRRHVGGGEDLAERLVGRVLTAAVRRGKFLWLLLDGPVVEAGPVVAAADPEALGPVLLAHLGMSGQLLVRPGAPDQPGHRHLRARLHLDGPAGPGVLDFVDQRTFGHLALAELVPTPDGAPAGRGSPLAALPRPVAHIGRDLLDPHLDRPALERALRRRRTQVKRALLDQGLVSGIGNIYADEALWRAAVHGARPTAALRAGQVAAVLDAAGEVMTQALAAGGTSFDALYVNVNGASGYFDRSLAVYGRAGLPCPRCGTPVVREAFMNRSSFSCPRCQTPPRPARRGVPSRHDP